MDILHVWRLERISEESRIGLRAVFLLGGTRKQEKSCWSTLGVYGSYWNSCVFLFAHPFKLPTGTRSTSSGLFISTMFWSMKSPIILTAKESPTKKQRKALPTLTSKNNEASRLISTWRRLVTLFDAKLKSPPNIRGFDQNDAVRIRIRRGAFDREPIIAVNLKTKLARVVDCD